jgi:hypothetical protein
MLDIDNLKLQDLDETLWPLDDSHLTSLKQKWYSDPQKSISHDEFVDKASAWFQSTKLNDLQGWSEFKCVDVIMGCTHITSKAWSVKIGGTYKYYQRNMHTTN